MSTTNNISADFPYESNYIKVNGSKIHYIEEGSGDPILFLHGQPTWSYLWRNVIPHVRGQGRAIALDLIGFGKSDKPDIGYRFFDHVKYVEGFIEKMGLKNVTLVIHDWGSALGFHYAMRHEDNVKGIAMMEAVFMPARYEEMPPDLAEFFQTVRGPNSRELLIDQNIFVEQVLPEMGVVRQLTEVEMNRYREPFLEPSSREPVWRWPQEVPIDGEPADVHQAVASYGEKLQQSELPKLLFYATPGAITPEPVVEWCKQNLKNLATVHIGQGAHYPKEDNPHLIGSELARWCGDL
jgi:haloalkane dehalogenase